MSVPLEGIIRPYQDADITPTPFTRPGQGSTPMVRLQIGYVGSIKTLGWSMSGTTTTKMGQAHHENPPTTSPALQAQLISAAGS